MMGVLRIPLLFGKAIISGITGLHSESPDAGVLSDTEIWDEIAYSEFDIYPLTEKQVQPASVDLRLGRDFKILKEKSPSEEVAGSETQPIDTAETANQTYKKVVSEEIVLEPGDCILGTTKEKVNLPDHILGEVEGRSSLGRLFVEVHKTAGVVDPGYQGEITLEIHNDNPRPVKLPAGQRVCQLLLHRLNKPSENSYGQKEDSKYQGQTGATMSRLHKDE